MRWLHFQFRAPLAAFGGEAIDARGVIRPYPAQSMLTGLFANALGWTRAMREEHQILQERIVYGVLYEVESVARRLTDYQTAQLSKNDRVWTTRGKPIGRDGGSQSYAGAHQRKRDYHVDLRLPGVMRLDPAGETPSLADLADSLVRPARPLFIGRKPCLPSASIFRGWIEAADIRAALASLHELVSDELAFGDGPINAFWPASEGDKGAYRTTRITDEKNWLTGLHGGTRCVCERRLGVVRVD